MSTACHQMTKRPCKAVSRSTANKYWTTWLVSGLGIALLTGCASFSPDGGRAQVTALVAERLGPTVLPEPRATASGATPGLIATGDQRLAGRLPETPLTAEQAVTLALLNNPRMQVALAQLDVAEADQVQGSRMRNPGFSFGRMRGGGGDEIERSVAIDLLGLLTLPMRSKIEAARFERAKIDAAREAVELAGQTRRAYYNAIASEQSLKFMQQVGEAASASAELGRRMARVGNWSRLDAAREQLFHAEASAQSARARQQALADREALWRLLGLEGSPDGLVLPQRLADVPVTEPDPGTAESGALAQRLDVMLARRDLDASAHALGLTESSAFLSVVELGLANKSSSGSARENGYEIHVELPLFDRGDARTRRAAATYRTSLHRVAALNLRARSEVREALSARRTARAVAVHYRDEVVPLRRQISDEVLLRYNGMLIGVFDLLSDAREQIRTVNAAILAQRDFWLADSALQDALHGSGAALPGLAAEAPAERAAAH